MLNFIPGPVTPHPKAIKAYAEKLGSPRLSEAFWEDYVTLQQHLQTIIQTEQQIAIMTGEGMLALWAGLKSCIQTGDKVVSLVNGLYGDGIASIAEKLGADVLRVEFADNAFDLGTLMQALEHAKPELITMVHCETPTGLLNPLHEIGRLKKEFGVPLLLVDAISSIGSTPINMDANHVDLLFGSSPKALSSLADISFVAVSDQAWHAILKRQYTEGYDCLLPFKDVENPWQLPYMPHWPGIRSLKIACKAILDEGLNQVFDRHMNAMQYCTAQLENAGYELIQSDKDLRSPSVTCAKIPEGHSWHSFNRHLNQRGLQVACGLDEKQHDYFRIGHMGTQANLKLLKKAMKILESV